MIAGRYRLESKLGDGGMSSVWAAKDTQAGDERVAVKLAMPSGVSWDEFEARFQREAAIGRYLGKAHGFVRVRECGKHGSRALFLIMDLIEDADELDLLNGTLMGRVDRLMRTAERVRDAHALGVVHRDLKPSNVLVRRSDAELFLADFGLAKVVSAPADDELSLDTLTLSGMTMGTLVYMAPEQMVDAKRAGPPADVFALGVMLYVALTGDLPFKGKTGEVVSTQQGLRAGTVLPPSPRQSLPNVPEELDALCVRCMSGDPAQRPTSDEVVAAFKEAKVLAEKRAAPTRRL